MAEEFFFANLPSEIIINILSRLPVQNIIRSKCVCKLWLHIIETPEFAKYHLSKSVPGLVLCQCQTIWLCPYTVIKVFDINETIEELEPHEHRYNLITEFDFHVDPLRALTCVVIEGSANGLLLFRHITSHPTDLYICNPITRQYIQFPSHERVVKDCYKSNIYGFGVSKTTDQYKVVRIAVEPEPAECEVYTLGTRTWRSVPCGVSFKNNCSSNGTLHDGKLHWLVPDLKGCLTLISSFDLKTETFSVFSPSPPPLPEGRSYVGSPLVFDGCLCLCNITCDDEIVIWMMKNEHWIKEIKISIYPDLIRQFYERPYPAMMFRDGDVLVIIGGCQLYYYSSKNRNTRVLDMFEVNIGCIKAMLHTSSFVSLKSFTMEDVSLF